MAQFPRGIAPDLLLSQVANTAPYLLGGSLEQAFRERFVPAKMLQDLRESLGDNAATELSHLDYFRLCLCAHYTTCGTPVPTDVDKQIRQKLWPADLPAEWAIQMAELVLESHDWDFTPVSTRFTYGAKGTPWSEQVVSGHYGEWFTVAGGAYCALGQYSQPQVKAQRLKIFEAIEREVGRHSEIFGSLWRAGDGLGCLKASASLAHNFGDLDRVLDMWSLDVGDPLRLKFYKLGVSPYDADRKLRYMGRLWVAGELYKETIAGGAMALENHRHFALRKPRCLRTTPELLVPTGPFFDDWGRALGRVLGSQPDDLNEVTHALVEGWVRLPKTYGYGRALRGIMESVPTLTLQSLGDLSRVPKEFRATMDQAQSKFESAWSQAAILAMDDIPGRA